MKTRLIAAALFFISCAGAFAQTKNDLMEATNKLINLSNELDYNGVIDMVHPRVFEGIEKDNYLQALQKKMKNDDYAVYFVPTEPYIDYGALTRFEDGYFCIIYYNVIMKVSLADKVDPKKEDEILKRFKNILNTEEIYLNAPENSLDAKNRVQVLAIADNLSYGQWRFILNPNDPKEQKGLNKSLQDALDPNYVQDPETMVQPEGVPADDGKTDVQKKVEKAAAEKAALLKKQQDEQKKPKKKA